MKNKTDEANTDLYNRAVALMNKRPVNTEFPVDESDTIKLLHELEVYKAELECQNEELVTAINAAQDAISLYDFAPTGFLTLSEAGVILNLNLRGAELLGKGRRDLIRTGFISFLTRDTIAVFYLFQDRMFNSKTRESCEVTLNIEAGSPVWVYLTGIASKTAKQCLVTMTYITGRKMVEKSLRQSQILLN